MQARMSKVMRGQLRQRQLLEIPEFHWEVQLPQWQRALCQLQINQWRNQRRRLAQQTQLKGQTCPSQKLN